MAFWPLDGGEADLLGPVEGDRGGGGVAEQMRVDRPAEGGTGVGDNLAWAWSSLPSAPVAEPKSAAAGAARRQASYIGSKPGVCGGTCLPIRSGTN